MTLVDMIMRKVRQAAELSCRLVVVAAPYGEGRSHAVHAVHVRTGAPLLNLYSVLSHSMRDLTEEQRQTQLPQLLGEVVSGAVGDLVLLDGAEILFQTRLKNPLRLLQDLARDRTVVVVWQGCVSDGRMISGPNGKRYPIRGFLVAIPEAETGATTKELKGERMKDVEWEKRRDDINELLSRLEELLNGLLILAYVGEDYTAWDGNGYRPCSN